MRNTTRYLYIFVRYFDQSGWTVTYLEDKTQIICCSNFWLLLFYLLMVWPFKYSNLYLACPIYFQCLTKWNLRFFSDLNLEKTLGVKVFRLLKGRFNHRQYSNSHEQIPVSLCWKNICPKHSRKQERMWKEKESFSFDWK